jgi:hypothetical protein
MPTEVILYAPSGSVWSSNVLYPDRARIPDDLTAYGGSSGAGPFSLTLAASYQVPSSGDRWGVRLDRVDFIIRLAHYFNGWASATLQGQTIAIPTSGGELVTYDPAVSETLGTLYATNDAINLQAYLEGYVTRSLAAAIDAIWWRLVLTDVWMQSVEETMALAVSATISIIEERNLSDTAAVSLSESAERADGIATDDTAMVTVSEQLDTTATVTVSETATLPDTSTVVAASVTYQSLGDTASVSDNATIAAGPASPQWISRPLRAMLTTTAGASVSVPVLSGRYRLELGRIGEMELMVQGERLPADPVVTAALFRQGEGLVCQGVVLTVERQAGQRGEVLCTLRCATMGRELALRPVVSYSATAASLSSVVDALLAGTGWTRGSVPTATVTVTVTGASRWQALADIADRLGCELREDPLQRRLDIVPRATFTPSGWAAITGPALDRAGDDPPVLPILELTASWDASELVTRVIPYAEPEGGRQARIENTTRTSPYTVQSATAEDGSTYYYLQDAAAAAVWGVRPQVVTWKGIAPQDDTTAEAQRAANELYDAAVAWLQARREPRIQLDVVTGSADHVDAQTGAYRIQVGQSIRVRARLAVPGVATTLDIDQELAVTSIERRFEVSGVDRWRLGVSTIARPAPDDVEALSAAIAALSGGTTVGTAPTGGGAGGGGGGLTRTLWDTLIEASLSGQLGTPWW